MIPYGMNPLGLENRTVQFHRIIVSDNSAEELYDPGKLQTNFTYRLYCYLTKPITIQRWYDNVIWAITDAWNPNNFPTQESYNSAPKYSDINNPPIVNGNLHLYDIRYKIILHTNGHSSVWPGLDPKFTEYLVFSTSTSSGEHSISSVVEREIYNGPGIDATTTLYATYGEIYPKLPQPIDKSGNYDFLNWVISGITYDDKQRMWANDYSGSFRPISKVFGDPANNGNFNDDFVITQTNGNVSQPDAPGQYYWMFCQPDNYAFQNFKHEFMHSLHFWAQWRERPQAELPAPVSPIETSQTKTFKIVLKHEHHIMNGDIWGYCGRYLELQDNNGGLLATTQDTKTSGAFNTITTKSGSYYNVVANNISQKYTIPGTSCTISWEPPKSMAYVYYYTNEDNGWSWWSEPVGLYDNSQKCVTKVEAGYVEGMGNKPPAKKFTYYYSWANTYYDKSCIQNWFNISVPDTCRIKINGNDYTSYTIKLDSSSTSDQVITFDVVYPSAST